MGDINDALAEIDSHRIRRRRELSYIQTSFSAPPSQPNYGAESQAVVVLCYAHWEGFYNDSVEVYLNYLKSSGKTINDLHWNMLLGLVTNEFQRLVDRNNSLEAQCDLVDALEVAIKSDLKPFDSNVVRAKSNLDFKKIKGNFRILGIDASPLQRVRLRLDREIVGWRHLVAHGTSPDLSKLDVVDHVQFTSSLLLMMSDIFQQEIVRRLV